MAYLCLLTKLNYTTVSALRTRPKTDWNTNPAPLFAHTSTLCSTAQILIKHHSHLLRWNWTDVYTQIFQHLTGVLEQELRKKPKGLCLKAAEASQQILWCKERQKGARGITHPKPPHLQFSILLKHQEKITFVASQVKHNEVRLFLGKELKWSFWKHWIGTQM